MRSWFADTLSRRLLLLMWGALVGSHLLAFTAVTLLHARPGPPPDAAFSRLPTLPSLPPTPGLPGPALPQGPGGHDARGPGGPAGPGGPPPLPWNALLLDYGVRFVVIAAAAWWGSRWLSRPVRRLVEASRSLSESIGHPAATEPLDERAGTVEVREAARVFNRMASQLREQFNARGLMVAAISHDLRTPLTRLRMRLETSAGDGDLLHRSVADIREMNALIDGALEVFRPEDPSRREPMQSADVHAMVQALVDDLAEQGQAVHFQGDPAITSVQPQALRRVVANLIGNALRYGETAQVSVTATAQDVLIRVDDRGPGIPADELEAVFQPYYRVEASRNRHTGGTGLGLYIARDLTRRQGGTLTLANRPEGGLRAEIRLQRR